MGTLAKVQADCKRDSKLFKYWMVSVEVGNRKPKHLKSGHLTTTTDAFSFLRVKTCAEYDFLSHDKLGC